MTDNSKKSGSPSARAALADAMTWLAWYYAPSGVRTKMGIFLVVFFWYSA